MYAVLVMTLEARRRRREQTDAVPNSRIGHAYFVGVASASLPPVGVANRRRRQGSGVRVPILITGPLARIPARRNCRHTTVSSEPSISAVVVVVAGIARVGVAVVV